MLAVVGEVKACFAPWVFRSLSVPSFELPAPFDVDHVAAVASSPAGQVDGFFVGLVGRR